MRLAGHEVRFSQPEAPRSTIGDGFVEKVSRWEDSLSWADVIVFDDTLGFGAIAERLRAEGRLVIGGTSYTDRLEEDKSFGQHQLAEHGVPILPVHTFVDLSTAINFLQEQHKPFVLKPMGAAQNIKSILCIGEAPDNSDTLAALKRFDREVGAALYPLQLQERVFGIEVAVGAFFNGREFLRPYNINFEHKRLFPGDIGPLTGEMGTSMLWVEHARIFEQTLARFSNTLKTEGFCGYIDLNCIVTKDFIAPLEFSSRFGYPTIFIQMESLEVDVAELLFGMAQHQRVPLVPRARFHVGIRGCVPPYPLAPRITFPGYCHGTPIRFRNGSSQGVHFEDAMLIDGEWRVAGVDGVPLVAVGSGATMECAREAALRRLENVCLNELYYRNDIGSRWTIDGPRLVEWGYIDAEHIA